MRIRQSFLGLCVLALAACGGGGGGSDEDVPGTLALSAATYGAAEAAGTVTITVTRTGGDDGAASVQYATSNGSATAGQDYTATNGTLNWADGDDAAKTFNVALTNDADVEGDETVTITLSNATGAALGTPATATLTLTSEDAAVTLTGTAATGAPIVGATVTLKDAAGTTRTTTTGADGGYTLDINGLTPPFLVQVALDGGGALFSVSNADDPDVVNVHPLTDLVIRAWYQVQGTTVETAFAAPVANPAPTPEQVEFIVAVVETVIETWLTGAGLDPEAFDLIATPFDADGTGFDGVLDDTTVNAGTGEIAIDDGTTNQQADIDVDNATDTITVDSTITGPGGSSSSSSSAIIPADDALADALTAIGARLAAFATTVNGEGATLIDDDLLPFFATDTLAEGLDRTLTAGNFASFLRGATITGFEVTRVVEADLDNGVIRAELAVEVEIEGLPFDETLDMYFHESGGTWSLAGDQKVAESSVHFERRIDMFSSGTTVNHSVNVDTRPLVGTVTGVSVTGGGVFTDADVPDSGQISIDEFEPEPGQPVQVQRNAHFLNSGDLEDPIAPGTEFTITLTLAAGGTATIVETTGGTTDEVVTITSPSAHTLAAATLGQALTVQWTLPTTYALADIDFGGQAFTAAPGNPGFSCEADSPEEIALNATSAQLTFPTTCNGEAVVHANINLSFNGVNGERIMIIYSFE